MEKDKTYCVFKQYGQEERVCIKCGYVIPATDNDLKALNHIIKTTGERPKCEVFITATRHK